MKYNQSSNRLIKSFSLFTGISIFLLSTASWAQVTDGVGTILTTAGTNTGTLTKLLTVTSYILGGFLGFSSILRLLKKIEGHQISFMDPALRFLGAGMLIVLPYILSAVIGSFGLTAHVTQDQSLAPAGAAGGLDQQLISFMNDVYVPAKLFIKITCYILGGYLGINGILRLAKSGQEGGRAPNMGGTIGHFISAAALISLAQIMDAITHSLFGGAVPTKFTSLSYSANLPNADAVNNVVKAVFAFIEVLGWIAFARGVLLLKKLSEGEGQKSHLHAFTHIIAGGIAVNMNGFLTYLQHSLGTSLI